MEKLKVLIIGGGGREHALAWKLKQSKVVAELFCAPGNAGIREIARCVPLKADDIPGLVAFAVNEGIGLVVIGPEQPLTMGVVDELEKTGVKAFGPSKLAAEIEGSKSFAKGLMSEYNIPTARYGVFTDVEKARRFSREIKGPWVIKADGLAAGKGVLICETQEETDAAIAEVLSGKTVGAAGEKIIIEEYLEGEELSILAFCDGKTAIPMVPSQDHKRAFDGDKGPNTGGMGAYSPVPRVTPELMQEIEETILRPVLKAMEQEGRPYRGVLYPGLMLTKEGPKVLEFNARFGDPETQVVLPRLASDLGEIMLKVVEGKLAGTEIAWKEDACVTVVMASGGYPSSYRTGFPITGLEEAAALDNVVVFHSGTEFRDGTVVTKGGRVLSVTGLGKDLPQALDAAYEGIKKISFEGSFYRSDIAHRALKTKN